MRKKAVFFMLMIIILLTVLGPAQASDYQFRSGDMLRIGIWQGGFSDFQEKTIPVRPDGKITLVFNINQLDNGVYRLGPGDILDVGVWGYPELQLKGIMVRPDGKMGFPLVGEVTVAERTPVELAKYLTGALNEYVKNPQVTVNVIQFRPVVWMEEINVIGLTADGLTQKIVEMLQNRVVNPRVAINIDKFGPTRVYVLGEVVRPGVYELQREHTLLDAVGAAGGCTRYAVKKTVHIIQKETGQYITVNLDSVLKKGDLSQNLQLGDGDLVYLASNNINFINDVLPYLTAIYQISNIFK